MNDWRSMCIELWGDRWKSTLALTVGVRKRQVQRWNKEEPKIKQQIVDKINQTWNVWRKKNDAK